VFRAPAERRLAEAPPGEQFRDVDDVEVQFASLAARFGAPGCVLWQPEFAARIRPLTTIRDAAATLRWEVLVRFRDPPAASLSEWFGVVLKSPQAPGFHWLVGCLLPRGDDRQRGGARRPLHYGPASLWKARRVAAALQLFCDACGAAGHDVLDAVRRAFPIP
jgi:hypothetical protein